MAEGPRFSGGLPKYKVVFLGDQGVGKTSLMTQYISNTFDTKIHPTVGVDFISKSMTIGDRPVKLHLWDTAGQERFHSLIPSYIRDSAIAVIIYDIGSRQSCASVKKWFDEVRQYREHAIIAIVGNKLDLPREKRVVAKEELDKLGKELDAITIEASAKTGENIKELFEQVILRVPLTEISQNLSVVGTMIQSPNQIPYTSDRGNIQLKNKDVQGGGQPGNNEQPKKKCC